MRLTVMTGIGMFCDSHTMLLGYKQNRTVTVSPEGERSNTGPFRICCQGGPGKFLGLVISWWKDGISPLILCRQDFIAEADSFRCWGASSIVSEILVRSGDDR